MTFADQVPTASIKPNDYKVFLADQQTAGYGVAAGSHWTSPLGNMYMTMVFSVPAKTIMQYAIHIPQITSAAVMMTL